MAAEARELLGQLAAVAVEAQSSIAIVKGRVAEVEQSVDQLVTFYALGWLLTFLKRKL